jgi:hypothetical protein
MNDNPASSIAAGSPAEIGHDGHIRQPVSIHKGADVGTIVNVSARLPSNASTISGNPAWSVSSPMVICGHRGLRAGVDAPDPISGLPPGYDAGSPGFHPPPDLQEQWNQGG